MTNETKMAVPEVHSFEQILGKARAKAAAKKPRAALVVPSDIDMLKAFVRAAVEGLIDPVILGDESLLKKNAAEAGVGIDRCKTIDVNQPDAAVTTAGQMAAHGEVDMIVKGRFAGEEFLRRLFAKDAGFVVKGRTVCHIAVIKPQLYPKLLFLTDAGVIVQPNLMQKVALVQNAVDFAARAGVDNPRVALLAAVEVVYPQMPMTIDGAVVSKMAERKQIKGAFVDGPLSFDCAVDMVAAHSKGIKDSQVAGQADILVAPNIETANGVYTAMSLYGRAEVGGFVHGGRVPAAMTFRSDSPDNKYRSIVLAALAA